MFCVIDDFLPLDDFREFSLISKKASSSNWGTRRPYSDSPNWTHHIYKSDYDDLSTETSKRFGSKLWNIACLIENRMKQDIDDLPPIFSLGFLFSKHPYVIRPHFDNIYKHQNFNSPSIVADSYSAFYYGHDSWDPSWGGILGFHKSMDVDKNKSEGFDSDNCFSIEPKPNRLVFYSLDTIHSVTPIVNKHVIRQTLKMSFFRITKMRRHVRSIESQIDHTYDF